MKSIYIQSHAIFTITNNSKNHYHFIYHIIRIEILFCICCTLNFKMRIFHLLFKIIKRNIYMARHGRHYNYLTPFFVKKILFQWVFSLCVTVFSVHVSCLALSRCHTHGYVHAHRGNIIHVFHVIG